MNTNQGKRRCKRCGTFAHDVISIQDDEVPVAAAALVACIPCAESMERHAEYLKLPHSLYRRITRRLAEHPAAGLGNEENY